MFPVWYKQSVNEPVRKQRMRTPVFFCGRSLRAEKPETSGSPTRRQGLISPSGQFSALISSAVPQLLDAQSAWLKFSPKDHPSGADPTI